MHMTSGEEMRNWMAKWTASKMFKEFKEKRDLMRQRSLNKNELIALCQSIIQLNQLSYEEKAEFEFLEEVAIASSTKLNLYKEFSNNLLTWFSYLKTYLDTEDFEICSLLRDVIEIEKTDFFLLLSKYCQEFDIDADTDSIIQVDEHIRKIFGI